VTRAVRTPRTFVQGHLAVSPDLLGLPLASPLRRFLALVVDGILVLPPSILVALSAAILSVWITDPAALRGISVLIRSDRPGSDSSRRALKDVAPLLVRLEAPGLPAEAIEAVEKGDTERAAEVLDHETLLFSLALGEQGQEKLGPKTVRVPIERMIPKYGRAVALYGIAALYFTLLTRSRRGATLGKRLLGIRVVSVGGGRLGLLESFERFAAYLEIPATLGFCLISLWRDPNRRLPHDRLANTVVVRSAAPAPRVEEDAGAKETDRQEAES